MSWFLDILQSPRLNWLMPSAREMVSIGIIMGLAQDAVEKLTVREPAERDMLGSFVLQGLSREDTEGETGCKDRRGF